MANRIKAPLNVFAHIPTRSLPEDRADEIRADYRDGRFDLIFPAGSAGLPAMLVGRERQMAQLSALAQELLEERRHAPQSLLGVVLHGPRGTGKTALLDAFAYGVDEAGGRVVDMTGSALKSEAHLTGRLADLLGPIPEESEAFTGEGKGGFGALVVKGEFKSSSERRITKPGGWPSFSTVEGALSAVLERSGGGGTPLLLSVDEAHAADPEALGSLLNAVQKLSRKGGGPPVAIALAGTPDVVDVLRAAPATWFLDRSRSKRLVPMPNDLTPSDCATAMRSTLDAVGVAVRDRRHLAAAAEACRGSPYFLQELGQSALAFAARNNDLADFAPDGETAAAFRSAVVGRYAEAWSDLDRQGLTGCARQLGALWRARGDLGSADGITEGLVSVAIQSGLAHAPSGVGADAPPSVGQARAHFKHLGLLWSIDGAQDGPWSLGLPSFFDYAEEKFDNPMNLLHHAALPGLRADMEDLLGGLTANSGSKPSNEEPGSP